jgi:hypothetical protein
MTQLKIATAAIALLAAFGVAKPAAADAPVPCTGDAIACQDLRVTQRGTDPQSGAHITMTFSTRPGMSPQSMMLTLSIATSQDSCGSATDTYANVNPDDTRSIDGYLCKFYATYERH